MADEKGISISEFICSSCEDIAKKKIEKDIQKEKIEARINNTEMKVQQLKKKLNAKRCIRSGFRQFVLRFR